MHNIDGASPRRRQRVPAAIRTGVIALLIAAALFEVGMRVIPLTPLQPDEMVYTREDLQPVSGAYVSTVVDLRASQSTRAQRVIEEWYLALNRSPTSWGAPTYCNGMEFTRLSVSFKWHGATIQSWSGNSCDEVYASSGGVINVLATHQFDVNTPMPTVS